MSSPAATAADPIGELYDVADDYEAEVLDRLRHRTGQVWECYGVDVEVRGRSCIVESTQGRRKVASRRVLGGAIPPSSYADSRVGA